MINIYAGLGLISTELTNRKLNQDTANSYSHECVMCGFAVILKSER